MKIGGNYFHPHPFFIYFFVIFAWLFVTYTVVPLLGVLDVSCLVWGADNYNTQLHAYTYVLGATDYSLKTHTQLMYYSYDTG